MQSYLFLKQLVHIVTIRLQRDNELHSFESSKYFKMIKSSRMEWTVYHFIGELIHIYFLNGNCERKRPAGRYRGRLTGRFTIK
jgi:hypothetical protein